MSQKTQIYENYLANFHKNHPNVVHPTWPKTHDDIMATIEEARKQGKKLTNGTKAISNGIPEGSYQMPDGRVIEVAQFENGISYMACVHASYDNYRNYAEPMSMNMYWNG